MSKGFLFDLDGVFYVSDHLLKGANELGLFSILVKIGKYKKYITNHSQIKPILIIHSISAFPVTIKNLKYL